MNFLIAHITRKPPLKVLLKTFLQLLMQPNYCWLFLQHVCTKRLLIIYRNFLALIFDHVNEIYTCNLYYIIINLCGSNCFLCFVHMCTN